MIDLTTHYLGIPLQTPLLVAACPVSARLDAVKRAEEAGAGGLVIRSLFEEQLLLDRQRLEEDLAVGSDSFPRPSPISPISAMATRASICWQSRRCAKRCGCR
jgi:hypothetical protein